MIGATITLGVGVLGVAGLLFLKHLELKRGRIVFSGLRVRIEDAIYQFFAGGGALSRVLSRIGANVRSLLHDFAKTAFARSLIAVERSLEKALHTVRKTKETGGDVSPNASPFLEEVIAYKKKLRPRAATLRKLGRE